jgi:uncharacterized protein YjbI with pentapeptide repeats
VLIRVAGGILSVVVVIALIREGYDHPWTGFGEHEAPSGMLVPAKTFWDWLELLVVPLVLAIGAFLLDGSRKRSEREVEADRQRQTILDEYFKYISDLLLEKYLLDDSGSNRARNLARTRTLAALRLLDGKRKAQVLQFLYEARLIGPEPIVQLNGADFRCAVLDEATLTGAELRGVYFTDASMRRARLVGADLRGSDFSGVDFSASDLAGARLAQARLDRADLRTAKLTDTDLTDVDLANVLLPPEQRASLGLSSGTRR